MRVVACQRGSASPARCTWVCSFAVRTGGRFAVRETGRESGQRFHYTYGGSSSGDINGDGVGNDLIYVPKDVRDSNEIIFVPNGTQTVQQQQDALQAFIQSHKCLRDQVGKIMERNSCQEPFHHTFNFSMRQRIGALVAQLDLDLLLACGHHADDIAHGAERAGMPLHRIAASPDMETAKAVLDCWLEPGDTLLIKGSRSTRMERILDWLKDRAHLEAALKGDTTQRHCA